jgi:phytoene dehydrogenase-like protein
VSDEVEVAVVGAGLAGLACAIELADAGRDVVVLEAGDGVGGRVRTDLVDGFRLDRGFQVLLTAYPALGAVDLDALDLRAFSPGVVVRRDGRFRHLADPLRAPVRALGGLLGGAVGPADAARLLAWRRELNATPGPRLAERPQTTTAQLLAERGFSARLVEGFFRPLLSGVFFDERLTTSSRLTELVLRCFFRGEVAVPAQGMQALADQLAARLPGATVRLSSRVASLEGTTLHLEDGGRLEAGDVVVATDAPAASRLLGDEIGVPAPGSSTTTLHYAAPASPVGGSDLVLGADGDGPVVTLAVMSDVADTYAPPGRSLVTVSTLELADDDSLAADLDARVRRQLTGWYGPDVEAWELLRADAIRYAQPRQTPADLTTLARRVRLGGGRWVCGDHRDTGSIQGALVSGRRTARELLRA